MTVALHGGDGGVLGSSCEAVNQRSPGRRAVRGLHLFPCCIWTQALGLAFVFGRSFSLPPPSLLHPGLPSKCLWLYEAILHFSNAVGDSGMRSRIEGFVVTLSAPSK